MKVEKFVTGIISTNCYLVINEETKQTVVVDPADCPSYLMGHMKSKELKVEAILLTHGHFDHTMGLEGFLKEFKVPVYVHEDEAELLMDPTQNLSGTYTSGYTFSGASYVKEGQVIKEAGYEFKVMHTPGHTRGGCCYYVESENVLFSGDTLFQASIGRTDFPQSSASDLLHSLREKVMLLPDDTTVYPGHMGKTTIGYERMHNPFI